MYRLVEYYRTGGPITLSARFWSADAATAVAESIIDHLHIERPARCPYQLVVVDAATGEIVQRVRPYLDTDWDPDPFGHTDHGAATPTAPGATDAPEAASSASGARDPAAAPAAQKREPPPDAAQ